MNKQELIEELARHASCLEDFRGITGHCDGKYEAYEIAIGLAKQLDEPQKVKVPKCVAEWIEQAKKERQSLYEAMWNIESSTYYHKYDNAAYQWMFEGALHDEHQELFTEAYMHGYEVEKEPLYRVKLGEGYFVEYQGRGALIVPDDNKEIKVFDSKSDAERTAQTIGGTVEEVVEG